MRRNLLLLSVIIGAGIAGMLIFRSVRSPVAARCTFIALDVGQGDAIFIRTPDGQDALIDGGPNERVIAELSRVLPPGDDDLELVVSTHPDSDHLAGLIPVLGHFRATAVLTTGVDVPTAIWRRWQNALTNEGATVYDTMAGQQYRLGRQATLDVLWPVDRLAGKTWTGVAKNGAGGTNDTGIVLKVTCAGSTALLMADVSSDVEAQLVARSGNLSAPLLKVGHHGSRFSSSAAFLAAVRPTWAVISVGRRNRYGHPHPVTLLRLAKVKATVRRTDQEGDIRLFTDGKGGWQQRH